jgi:hypothetical protein
MNPEEPDRDPAMTQQITKPPPAMTPHERRFQLLAALCLALGRRGCASFLLHPHDGAVVLYVPYVRQPQVRLGIGAVESCDRWLYIWGKQWSVAYDAEDAAARIIQAVS